MHFVGVLEVAAVLVLLALRRSAAAGSVVVLTAPWLIIAYTYHVQSGYDVEGTALLVALPILWLIGAWIGDVVRPKTADVEPA